MRLISAVVSDRGLSQKRPVNEDSFLALVDLGLFAVADGVGGAQAGDFASQTAMEVLSEAFSHVQTGVDHEELLEMAIQRANESIFQMTQELPQFEMMATTIVTLHLNGNIATIGHVGDSRLYRLSPKGVLTRETNDHSIVAEEVRAGRMTEAQAANHPSRNVISRALGAEGTVEVEMRTIMFEPDTTFLLCSDGITRHVSDAEIKTILTEFESLDDACAEFKRVCYERGAEDNLTALVVRAESVNASNFARSANGSAETKPLAAIIESDDEATILGGAKPGAAVTAKSINETNAFPAVSPEIETAPLDSPASLGELQNLPANPTKTRESVEHSIHPQTAVDVEPHTTKKSVHSGSDAEIVERVSTARNAAPTKTAPSKWFNSLLLLLVGAALGAGVIYGLIMLNPPSANAPAANNSTPETAINSTAQQPQTTQTSALTNQAIGQSGELNSLETARRSVDSQPRNADSIISQPQTAADYYLLGRAHLQTGEYDRARRAFDKAANLLAEFDNGNQETVRVDIATAQAALSVLTKSPEDARPLSELIKNKRAAKAPETRADQAPAPQ